MPRLALNLLGQFQALLDDVPISRFDSDKTRALLAYLVLERDRAHRRESLAALLWPNVLEASARQSLSQALSNLRKAMGGEGAFLIADRDTVQFSPQAPVRLDVERVLDPALAAETPEALAELHKGPLLEGFSVPGAEGFEEWLLLRREMLLRQVLEHFDNVIGTCLKDGRTSAAIVLARKQLAIDGWREESHRNLMRAYALAGQRGEALKQYETCRAVLQTELGVEPSRETHALLQEIKGSDSQPAATQAPIATRARMPASVLPASVLPASITPFWGRQAELAQLGNLLTSPDARLISVVGMGGMGKTRLALQAARQGSQRAVFVPLVAVTQAGLALPAIAEALGASAREPAQMLVQAVSNLQATPTLLLLDNVEHLIDPAAGPGELEALIEQFLREAPALRLLVTSRTPLNMPGEWVFDLHGLGTEAPEFLLRHAQRLRAGWQPTVDEHTGLERICALTGGMPLALELAAGWLRVLSPREVADELSQRMDVLSTQGRGVDERHRSIAAVLDSTWSRLRDDEKRVMAQLAVFQGGFQREAAVDVAGATLQALSALVSRALVQALGGSRFALHELIRQYAANQPASEKARAAHAAHYARLVDDDLSKPVQWFQRIQRDEANVQSALLWHVRAGHLNDAARMASTLIKYHDRHYGSSTWGRELIAMLIDAIDRADGRVDALGRAHALHAFGRLRTWQDGILPAAESLQQSVALARAAPPSQQRTRVLGSVLSAWGWSMNRRGLHAEAVETLYEAARLRRECGDRWGLADLLRWLRIALDEVGRHADGEVAIRESIALWREIGDDWGLALALGSEAEALRLRGRLLEADAYYCESIDTFRKFHHRWQICLSLANRTHVLCGLGRMDDARSAAREAAELALTRNAGYLIAIAMLAVAGIFSIGSAAQYTRLGATLVEAAVRVMQEQGIQFDRVDATVVDHLRAQFASQLSDIDLEQVRHSTQIEAAAPLLRRAIAML